VVAFWDAWFGGRADVAISISINRFFQDNNTEGGANDSKKGVFGSLKALNLL